MECWSRKLKFETLGSGLLDPSLQHLWNPVPEEKEDNTCLPKVKTRLVCMNGKSSLIMIRAAHSVCAALQNPN